MVHALEETWRLLRLDGALVNIIPSPEAHILEVHHDGNVHFAERARETLHDGVLYAEAAVEKVLDRGLFVIDQGDVFDFMTYGASVSEVRMYLDEQTSFLEEVKAEELLTREELLYAQVEGIMHELGEDAEFAIHESVRIARLCPSK